MKSLKKIIISSNFCFYPFKCKCFTVV